MGAYQTYGQIGSLKASIIDTNPNGLEKTCCMMGHPKGNVSELVA